MANTETPFKILHEHRIVFSGTETVAGLLEAGRYARVHEKTMEKSLAKAINFQPGLVDLKIINFETWIWPQWVVEIFRHFSWVPTKLEQLLALGAQVPTLPQIDTTIIALGTTIYNQGTCCPALSNRDGRREIWLTGDINENMFADKCSFLAMPGKNASDEKLVPGMVPMSELPFGLAIGRHQK